MMGKDDSFMEATRIARKKAAVLLREDFNDQVDWALLSLTKKGKLIKIGYGLYTIAKVSSLRGNIVSIEPLPCWGNGCNNIAITDERRSR
jgi:hypothetical protein